ncbi:MAG: hypothetical protein KME05_13270 [Gloeocapsa sp. UFS-A4-WI-NPMV-4B04]|nr:hypothetical protein [Gloeocapsa sp. UFS-A4-WI-NPMV-4B04]
MNTFAVRLNEMTNLDLAKLRSWRSRISYLAPVDSAAWDSNPRLITKVI